GKYRYYTCNNRLNGGAKTCGSKSIPMAKLDQAVLGSLAEKAFTPNRVRTILAELKTRFQSGQSKEQQGLAALKRELDAADHALSKLYEGVEKGILDLDSTLQARAQGHRAKREAILIEMAGLRRRQDLPLASLSAIKVQHFCQALKNVLLGPNKAFAKRYIRALVSDIRVAGDVVTITGSNVALAVAVAGTSALDQRVPRLAMGWLPDQGSNLGPAD
ncbi:MAG: zinc ribbon domain-containing protein, partial [Betaproteobacteria bacterium]|nr:zinc ribbon domain-containing protein [Betaproteobacteria bacterium]